MQTLLPYPDFVQSLKCLDYRRLGKQRVESMQIIQHLRGVASGWEKHPAVLMWRGHLHALIVYYNLSLLEWKSRGYVNNMKFLPYDTKCKYPRWFGNPLFHASHRSNLLRKDEEHYSQYGWEEDPDMPYFWPGGAR